MTSKIKIKDALKLWMGEQYDDNAYETYLTMKSHRCHYIFFELVYNRGGKLSGGPEYINFEEDTCDSIFF